MSTTIADKKYRLSYYIFTLLIFDINHIEYWDNFVRHDAFKWNDGDAPFQHVFFSKGIDDNLRLLAGVVNKTKHGILMGVVGRCDNMVRIDHERLLLFYEAQLAKSGLLFHFIIWFL